MSYSVILIIFTTVLTCFSLPKSGEIETDVPKYAENIRIKLTEVVHTSNGTIITVVRDMVAMETNKTVNVNPAPHAISKTYQISTNNESSLPANSRPAPLSHFKENSENSYANRPLPLSTIIHLSKSSSTNSHSKDDINTIFRQIITKGGYRYVSTSDTELIPKLAAGINTAAMSQLLTVFQEAAVLNIPEQPELESAIQSAWVANEIYEGTVSRFIVGVLGVERSVSFITDDKSGNLVISEIKSKVVPRLTRMKIGAMVGICGEILGHGAEHEMLLKLVKTVDFIVCGIYPSSKSSSWPANDYVNEVTTKFSTYMDGFSKIAPKYEIILNTAWTVQGEDYHSRVSENQYRAGVRKWAVEKRVNVILDQAFGDDSNDLFAYQNPKLE